MCSAIVDLLTAADGTLLRFFNTTLANPVFDLVMPVITSLDFWRYPILLALLGIALFGGRYGLMSVLVAVVLLTITDQLSSHFLKEVFGRIRPCHDVPGIRVLTGCGNSLSFPSSHAVNTMAGAVFFGWRYRRILTLLLGLSFIVSFSRVYIGIHYPFDVLAGWALGLGCALAVVWLYNRLRRRFPGLDNTHRWKWTDSLRGKDRRISPEG